jgi:Rod binding domain-containing protein
MQTSLINSHTGSMPAKAAMPMLNGRPDYQLADALTKVSPQAQTTSGIKGEGPFGDTPGTGVWRSMLTEQYSKNFAKAGGVGISNDVYRTLILQQANRSS